VTKISQAPSPGALGVLYTVVCAAPPALHIRTLIDQAQARGWDVCVILTPTAARWLEGELGELEKTTGHPVRSAYKLPSEPDVLPAPDAILVAPATSNTISRRVRRDAREECECRLEAAADTPQPPSPRLQRG
jgi:hypothetical protein